MINILERQFDRLGKKIKNRSQLLTSPESQRAAHAVSRCADDPPPPSDIRFLPLVIYANLRMNPELAEGWSSG